jgi:hypothetical protein
VRQSLPGVGVTIVGNRCVATSSEDIEDLACVIVTFRVCELGIAL